MLHRAAHAERDRASGPRRAHPAPAQTKQAGAQAGGQSGLGWTLVLRRQPARIVDGEPQGGYTEAFELVCCGCGDDPDLDYHHVSRRLQWIRGPYPIAAGIAAYEEHVRHHQWQEAQAREIIHEPLATRAVAIVDTYAADLLIVAYILVVAAAIIFTIRRRMGPVKTVILVIGLAILGYIVKATFVPFPAPPYSWDALVAGITLLAGVVLPFAYPPLRSGIRDSPLLKAGANALLGSPASDRQPRRSGTG